ncbi:hypothetical protein RSAG8_05920, partial [Rhizoctonia solani AG-8 WAC10335]
MSGSTLGSLVTTVAVVALPLLIRAVVARVAGSRQQASPAGRQANAQQNKPRKTSVAMHITVALYSFLALGMWYSSQSDLFTRLRLPITATGDQIRSALITQRPPEFIPLDLQRAYQQGNTNGLNIRKESRTSHPLFAPELDRTLQRIETFDIRLMYGRLGHSVIASCDWCATRDDYLLFSAVGLSLSYIALLCIAALVLPHNAPYLTQETFINTVQALAALSHVSTAQQSSIKNTRYAGLVREASLQSWADVTMRKVDAALEDEEFRTTLDQIRPPEGDQEKPAVERLKDWAGRMAGEMLRELEGFITASRSQPAQGSN